MIGVIFKYAWWLILPFGLYSIFKPVWRHYAVNVLFYGEIAKLTLLKINLPRDMISNPKSMENALAGLLGTGRTLTYYRKTMEGMMNDFYSLEMVGQEGDVSFYILCPHRSIRIVEKAFYGQFPNVEIQVGVEDYFNRIPASVPDENWNMWGAKLILNEPNTVPIRTYREFEDPVSGDLIDPLESIFEAMGSLGPGEFLIYQVQLSITEPDWRKAGETVRDKILEKYSMSTMADLESGSFMRMIPPHEQERLKAIQRKLDKASFECQIVYAYIARREVYGPTANSIIGGTFRSFESGNLLFVTDKYYTTSAYQFMGRSRARYRKRRLLQLMQDRDRQSTNDVLNIEEIATLWHFPTQLLKTPFIPRTESRTSPAPFNLPVGE